MTWLPPIRRAPRAATATAVRRAVDALIDGAPALRDRPQAQAAVRRDMMRIALAAADLLDADLEITQALHRRQATALTAGDDLGMQATRAAADQVRALKDALDFPTYVAGLITGVFRAMWQSNVAQMESISQLLQAVSASTDDFARTEVSDADAAAFLQRALPSESERTNPANVKKALGATDQEFGAASGNLLPLAKRALGRTRQQNLATLVMMGLNRIVIDKGQLHASMDMRVDARSAADATSRSRLDSRTNAGATAGGMFGSWGAAASVSTTVGIVKDDQSATSEEIASQAALRSSVDLVFRTEPIQLDAVASAELQKTIAATTVIPGAKWTDGKILRDTTRSTIDNLGPVQGPPPPPDLGQTLKSLTGAGVPGAGAQPPGDSTTPGTTDPPPETPPEPPPEVPPVVDGLSYDVWAVA